METAKICSLCELGHYKFRTADDLVDCIRDLAVFDNCQVFVDQVFTTENEIACETCDDGYFPEVVGNRQFCNLAVGEDEVFDCKKYKEKSRCKQCDRGFILSLSNDECIPNVLDPNPFEDCLNLKANISCAICEDGFYFSDPANGDIKCVGCSENIASTCKFCKPNQDEVCLICKSGFTQKPDDLGSCVSTE